MHKIVNLSSLITLEQISEGVKAFAKLHRQYSTASGLESSSIFTDPKSMEASAKYVTNIYLKNLDSLINPYKLGKISTNQFLEGMLNIFDFLADNSISFSEDDRKRINLNKANFLSVMNINELSDKHIALALIEEAWNKIVDFSDKDVAKFNYLLSQSAEDKIYLISNTNELNVHKILCALRKSFSQIEWNEVDLTVNTESQDEFFLEVSPNIFLCLSYKAHVFKTANENKEQQVTTPSLIKCLITELHAEPSDIEVVSQYDKDLHEARQLNIPDSNLHDAKDYYPNSAPEPIVI